jgi:predicted RecB family nuclease
MTHALSKSRYLMGCQCPKWLWLAVQQTARPAPTPAQQYQFDEGARVGELARGRFPGGMLIEAGHRELRQALAATRAAIEGGATRLYEATLAHGDVLVRADILTRRSSRSSRWSLYEVKKTSSVKDTHLDDLAIQKWVLEGAGLAVDQAAIVHLNPAYVRDGPLDLEQLFSIEPLDAALADGSHEIEGRVEQLLAVLRARGEPSVEIGPHCNVPYECEFKPHCWAAVPEYPVFDLSYGGPKAWRYWNAGVRTIEEIPLGDPLSPSQRVQVELAQRGGLRFERAEVARFLSAFEFPLYFFDFETAGPAIPPHDGLKPYQAMPFQFSVHRLSAPDAEPTHVGFLAEDALDPRARLADAMLAAIGERGSIVVYNRSFEARICRDLAAFLPGRARRIDSIVERMLDLVTPFQKRWVAHPEMRGSYSLKQVAPALVGEASRYADLEIAEGRDASLAFLRMIDPETPSEESAKIRSDLLAYCAEDTLSTVRIFEWLRKQCH